MFYNASSFKQDIRGWNTSSVSTVQDMFSGATAFQDEYGVQDTINASFFNKIVLKRNNIPSTINNYAYKPSEDSEPVFINKLFTSNPNIKTLDITPLNITDQSIEANERDILVFNLKAKDINNDNVDITNVTEENGIYLEINIPFADENEKYKIFKYNDNSLDILENQPGNYPFLLRKKEGTNNTYYTTLTSLSTIGVVATSNIPIEKKTFDFIKLSNNNTNNTFKKYNVLDNYYYRIVKIINPIRKINNYGSKSDKNLINRKLTQVRNKGSVPPSKKKKFN